MAAYETRMVDMEQNVGRLEAERQAREDAASQLPAMDRVHGTYLAVLLRLVS